MDRISIIADDLTGASDSGVQLARNGLKTHVVFDWASIPGMDTGHVDVIVIDTDSRSLAGEAAYRQARSAAQALKDTGFNWIYKKMDSTLRGNLGQEMNGVMDAFGFKAAFIAPAFPRIGRTTVQGIHYLNGVPVHETEAARDPRTPVPDSNLPAVLLKQSGRRCVSIGLDTLRAGSPAVIGRIEEAMRSKAELFVFDAETDGDLKAIAALLPAFGSQVLWGGSAGLAEFLFEAQRSHRKASTDRPIAAEGRVMLVAGSISGITREQVAEVNRLPNVTALELSPHAAAGLPDEREREITRCTTALCSALRQGRDVSLHAGSSPEQVDSARERGLQLGLSHSDVSGRIADTLGMVASRVVAVTPVKGLVLTGGDTAKAVCNHLGVRGFELQGEVEPGIPYGMLLGGRGAAAVTKAGAFGQKMSLCKAMQFIHLEAGGRQS